MFKMSPYSRYEIAVPLTCTSVNLNQNPITTMTLPPSPDCWNGAGMNVNYKENQVVLFVEKVIWLLLYNLHKALFKISCT